MKKRKLIKEIKRLKNRVNKLENNSADDQVCILRLMDNIREIKQVVRKHESADTERPDQVHVFYDKDILW